MASAGPEKQIACWPFFRHIAPGPARCRQRAAGPASDSSNIKVQKVRCVFLSAGGVTHSQKRGFFNHEDTNRAQGSMPLGFVFLCPLWFFKRVLLALFVGMAVNSGKGFAFPVTATAPHSRFKSGSNPIVFKRHAGRKKENQRRVHPASPSSTRPWAGFAGDDELLSAVGAL